MAMLDPFPSFFRVRDVAVFFDVTAITARKWFEKEDGVVRVPSGTQRDRLYIPGDVLAARLRRMNIPSETIERLLAQRSNGHRPPVIEEPKKARRAKKPVALEKKARGAHARKRGAA